MPNEEEKTVFPGKKDAARAMPSLIDDPFIACICSLVSIMPVLNHENRVKWLPYKLSRLYSCWYCIEF